VVIPKAYIPAESPYIRIPELGADQVDLN